MNSRTKKMFRTGAREFVEQYDREEARQAYCFYAAGFYGPARYTPGPYLDPTITSERVYTEQAAQIFNAVSGDDVDARAISSKVRVRSREEYEAEKRLAMQALEAGELQ